MYKRSSNNRCCFEVESLPDAPNITDMLVAKALDKNEISLEKVSLESKMKPRLRAESVSVIGNLKEGRKKG